MSIKHIHGALVLIIEDGKVLAVSRKDDHTNMSLPGGKLNLHEDHVSCAIRETYEETGYHVLLDLETSPFHDVYDGYSVVTFLAKRLTTVADETAPEETGLVKFVPLQEILDGSFGEYHAKMLKWFKIGEAV